MIRTELLAALKLAAPALGDDGDPVPALSHFCFEDDSVYAYNDIVCVIVGYKSGLTLGMHGSTLLGVLAASRTEHVEFKVKGGVATLIGGGRVELPLLEKENFVFSLPDDDPILTAALSSEVLAALEACLISVADDSLRPEYNGVTLRIAKTGMTLYSTDNLTATRVELKSKLAGRKEAALVLPKQAADLVLKLGKGGEAKLTVSEKIAIVEFGGEPSVTLVTKLLGTPSTKFDKVFEEHTGGGTPCKLPEGFSFEVEKATVLSSRESLKEMSILAGKGEVVLSVQAALGKMRTTLGIDDKKLAGGVTVSPDLVKRALPHVEAFTINDERSLVLSGSGGALTHVVAAVPQAAQAAEEVSERGK